MNIGCHIGEILYLSGLHIATYFFFFKIYIIYIE